VGWRGPAERLGGMAGGDDVPATTVRRWAMEAIELLAAPGQ
jgi:hypothetical protein